MSNTRSAGGFAEVLEIHEIATAGRRHAIRAAAFQPATDRCKAKACLSNGEGAATLPAARLEGSGIAAYVGGAMTALPFDLPGRILDGSPDGILVCDAAGQVRYWNHTAERVFGFSRAEALGASLDLIVPERLRERHWTGWKTVMATGQTRYGEGQLLAVPALHKDGRQISIEFSIQLLEDTAGRIEWVVAVIRDVTERYHREKALRAELKAALASR
jgi:PAS domain S-box-containing protein